MKKVVQARDNGCQTTPPLSQKFAKLQEKAQNDGSEKEAKNTDRTLVDLCSTVKNSARDPTFDNRGETGGHE